MRRVLFFLAVVALTGCTDPRGAQRALEDAGYSDIQIKGYDLFACSEDDTFHTGFTARSPSTGRVVHGVVCKGWFKGSTIRTF